MKSFNTSGPNIFAEHYTLERNALKAKGLKLVRQNRYFTIWAPRQTGKSTYFRQMLNDLIGDGFLIIHINVENYEGETLQGFLDKLQYELKQKGFNAPTFDTFARFSNYLQTINDRKLVLIIDEIEGLNPELFGQFLHTIRNLYHSRESHCLKSTILVGVSNIVGVVSDNASPFNIADNLPVPYFTSVETTDLLAQHTTETGQIFEPKVVEKIFEITAGQPGLVNGFAFQLVERNPDKKILTYNDYLEVEDWYMTEAIDKNIANIRNKATDYRSFVERLLFTEADIDFEIERDAIRVLHTNGIIKKSKSGLVEFWVPLYKKRLYKAFYPYTNGEANEIRAGLDSFTFFNAIGELDIPKLIEHYKTYVAKRGFKVFIEKNIKGHKVLKESGLIYRFETFLFAFVREAGGNSYREADAGLGKSDLLIYLNNREYLFETKKYYSLSKFNNGKKQVAHYARSFGLDKAVYLVFTPRHLDYSDFVVEKIEKIEGIEVHTYLVSYDEIKDFK
jgi:AAA-like domain